MILSFSIWLPIIFGLIILFTGSDNSKGYVRIMALIASLISFTATLPLVTGFDTSTAAMQFVEQVSWVPRYDINYFLGVDGISMWFVVLTAFITVIVVVAAWEVITVNVSQYMAAFLILSGLMIGVFASLDGLLFYVFFEAMLFPIYFLIGRFGGPQRAYAAMKFLLYSLVGGLFMLASLIGLYVVSGRELGTGTFDFETLTTLNMDPNTQKMLFLGFFFAFAVKAPMVPFHTWLPDATAEATPGTSTLLVGVLDKVGTFGMLHFLLPIFPEASKFYAPAIIVLAVISIFYGALLAIGQTDVMRLVAFTSISHFGFIVLGIFVMTSQGLSGSSFYMVNHGFSTGALFLVMGYLVSRRGSKRISDFGGVQKVAPLLTGVFLLAGLSGLALPGMSSFISEFLVLAGTFAVNQPAAIIATLGIVVAAVYILWLYQRMMTGVPSKEVEETVTEISRRELIAIAPVLAIIIGSDEVDSSTAIIRPLRSDQEQYTVSRKDLLPTITKALS